MKVCPECQSRFSGNESFCPNDATALVDARELSPGELTGLDLNAHIHLERLDFRDALAERYQAQLTDSETPLRVTVFNEGYEPNDARVAEFEARRDALGEAVPAEILSLHSVDLDGDRRFIAEEAPIGISVAEALEQRKTLDWKVAIRVTCAVGRALEYLDDHGVIYQGLNAQTIFISNIKSGQIQLGDWPLSVLAHPERPLEIDADDAHAFYGYSAYLAPETIRDAADTDQRSLVYSLGMLLYQLIVGKPPFTSKSAEDSLKRHLHEKPLKLSIACGGAGLHPDLDEILDMMWVKAPERRFQKIAAAIAALSSLLDEAPNAIAPPLVAAETPIFEKTPATEVEKAQETEDAQEPEETEEADQKKTMMGMPAVSMTELKAAAEAAETAKAAEDAEKEEATEAEGNEQKEDEVAQAADASDTPEDAAQNEEATPSIIIDESLLEEKEAQEKPADQDAQQDVEESPEPDESAAHDETQDDDEEEKEDTPSIIIDDSLLGDDAADEEVDAKAESTSAEQEATQDDADAEESEDTSAEKEDVKESSEKKKKDKKGKKNKKKKKGKKKDKGKKDEESDAQEEKEAQQEADSNKPDEDMPDESAEDEPTSKEAPKKSLEIGFLETENDGGGEFAETWFGADADSAWDQSQIQEHMRQSENRQKYITFGIIGVIVVVILAFIFIAPMLDEEPAEEPDVAAQEAAQAEEDTARNKRFRASFDQAVAEGQLIRPRGGSALASLEKLKRFAEDDALYSEARATFVEKTVEAARRNEDENLQYAASLAGYASQFAEGDAEVDGYAKQLNERLRSGGAAAPAQKDSADASSQDSDASAAAGDSSADGSAAATGSNAKRTANTSAKRSVAAILGEAKAAEKSDDLNSAAKLYREAIAASPSTASTHARLGNVLFNQAKYTDALGPQKKAVQLAPRNNSYANDLGKTHYRLKQYKAAKKQWDTVIKRDPDNSAAKTYLGLIEGKL